MTPPSCMHNYVCLEDNTMPFW